MYEYEIENKKTNQKDIIFGYSVSNAFERNNLDINEWDVLFEEYID